MNFCTFSFKFDMNNYLKYLKQYFLFLCISSIFFGIPIWYLQSVGEYMTLNEIVEKQKHSFRKLIYGTVLHNDMHSYKKLLLKNNQAKIIALGSSRIMQFRQHMFVKKFINLGGAMGSINEGISLIKDITDSKPDIVLIAVDVWWFNDNFQRPESEYKEPKCDKKSINLRDPLNVFKWLYYDKITLKSIFNAIIGSSGGDIGVSGQEKVGFGPDGSYYYTTSITGKKDHSDKQFINTFQRIIDGNRRFQYSSSANNQHINNFLQLVRTLEENAIKVIIFFPPFSKAVSDRINEMGKNYQYISDIKVKFHQNNLSFYDYTDPSVIDSFDCEFMDGFHGGEVTYARILRDLSRKVAFLNDFADQALLSEYINKYEGKAFIPDEEITDNIEIDFLGLGCKK